MLAKSERRRYLAATAALVSVVASLGLAAPSGADPGTPGVAGATEGAYSGTNVAFGQNELGAGDPGGESPTAGSGKVTGGGGLPFTGLLAPAMLVAGLIVLLLGLALRPLARAHRI
ncbi:MAG TPA: hypothetical protein VHJ54_03935 [Solirubrobacterales bacterium]|jgi:hypothetical protein|nr:hypothetical protein [Solirubrobacterales bacterium]